MNGSRDGLLADGLPCGCEYEWEDTTGHTGQTLKERRTFPVMAQMGQSERMFSGTTGHVNSERLAGAL